MIKRRKARSVKVGTVHLGARAPIAVQSMCKVPTTDVDKCLRQIRELMEAGCVLVRVAVPRKADTANSIRLMLRSLVCIPGWLMCS